MKQSFVACILALALSLTPAIAADLPARATSFHKAPDARAIHSWTGFYIGGNLGYGWSHIKETSPTLPGVEISSVGTGILGGGQAGYNWQTGSYVLGVEGDISGSSIKGNTSCPLATLDCRHNLTWMTTARVRGGVLVNANQTLIYATGGAAWAHINYKEIVIATGALFNTGLSKTHSGWTVGGGVEQKLTPNLSVKVEYLYLGLSNASTPAGTLSANAVDINANVQTVRVGLNYHF